MKVAVTSPSFSKNEILRKELSILFPDVRFNENGERLCGEKLYDFVKDAEALIVGLEKFDSELLMKCSNLKIVSKYGVGLNNLDVEYCKSKNIVVGWVPGVNKLSVAEMALGYMLMHARGLYQRSNELKNGNWNKNGGFQLSGKTIGIVGFGNIGQELVRLLKPFNCNLMINDIRESELKKRHSGIKFVMFEELIKASDFVSLHIPFDQTTENLISINELKAMKSTAYLLNTSRGGIVNEDDLLQALISGDIAGAALDVFCEEPPTDMRLIECPNLICTPHIGGNAREAVLAMGRAAINNIKENVNNE